ncbi:MAG: aminotransferase class V-fold PLP-dependent enzyme [Candidatus Binatia bacterium]|nr:aminotransferase class V-fold PLP-dependent enzyme [Candidatus Binatia bacterium]
MADQPFDARELAEIRAEFPALQRYVYLASNGMGLLPRRAVSAATAVLRKLAREGIVFEIFHVPRVLERARQRVADFLGADADEIAFCRNTTEGLLWAAESLPWQPGDEVLLVQGSHYATVLPFLSRRVAGLEVRWVRPRSAGACTSDDFAAAWGERTRGVVVSWVEFYNGFRHDLAGLVALAHERGAWVVCDAVQGWGALPFSARTMRVDVAAAGAQKWLLGPPGVGICFIAREAREHMRLYHVGANSLVDPHEPAEPLSSYDVTYAGGARCFEEGTRNIPGISALEASVSWLMELGIGRIAAQIRAVSDYLAAELSESGWKIRSTRERELWSGILLLEPPPGENAEHWMHRLHQRHIAINYREGCLHLGIHFYNGPEDIDAFIAAVKQG